MIATALDRLLVQGLPSEYGTALQALGGEVATDCDPLVARERLMVALETTTAHLLQLSLRSLQLSYWVGGTSFCLSAWLICSMQQACNTQPSSVEGRLGLKQYQHILCSWRCDGICQKGQHNFTGGQSCLCLGVSAGSTLHAAACLCHFRNPTGHGYVSLHCQCHYTADTMQCSLFMCICAQAAISMRSFWKQAGLDSAVSHKFHSWENQVAGPGDEPT